VESHLLGKQGSGGLVVSIRITLLILAAAMIVAATGVAKLNNDTSNAENDHTSNEGITSKKLRGG
jgi:hypothetical protein